MSVLAAKIERVLKGGGQRVWRAYDEHAYGHNVEERRRDDDGLAALHHRVQRATGGVRSAAHCDCSGGRSVPRKPAVSAIWDLLIVVYI